MKIKAKKIVAILIMFLYSITIFGYIDNYDKNGRTKLMNASREGNLKKVKQLLSEGADVNKKSKYGVNSLGYAVEEGHLEVVKALIDSGSNINDLNDYRQTSLMYAAAIGNVEIVKLLLQSGADKNKVDLYGNTALSITKTSEHESTSEKKKKEILSLLQ